jgi:dimethylhistidine N-methyltransferase
MITTKAPPPLPLRSAKLAQFRADVLRGLRGRIKSLPCKYFYDQAGSELFEQITQLAEYYPTRTELGIMHQHVAEMVSLLGERCLLIEYGSGSSMKTRLLLDRLVDPAAYVPIDVSDEPLQRSALALAVTYPGLEIRPLCADFTQPLCVPAAFRQESRRVVYFPGSTIGNFTPQETIALFARTASLCGAGGGLLLGADMRKDTQVIEAAYNDSLGVTARFNRNLLVRINRELGADFQVEQFAHVAFYNGVVHRIEMHLVSSRPQRLHVGDEVFFFEAGESICTEYSYKYSLDCLRDLAEASGFELRKTWLDDRDYFSVSYLTAKPQ